MSTFNATVFRVTTDADGETKITLAVPSEQLDKVIPLSALGGKLLTVSVEVDPSQR